MDETTDMMRSVRDARYKYIRNYMPERPYAQRISYMDEMPTMQEWRRLAAEDKLVGPQKLFFAPNKPLEELYDTQADPHEINNLANDPQHGETLARLRKAHEQWVIDTKDIGLVPEAEVMEQRRPGGKFEITATPKIEIRDGQAILTCDTPGASIAYTFTAKGDQAWLLYTQPIEVKPNQKIRVQAFRLGFKESEVSGL
jgi:uncharacterized sulfatase